MKISILLVTYNHASYIRQCLEGISIQETQTIAPPYRNLEIEIILADDCSVDDTVAIVRATAERLPAPVTYLSTDQNLGFVKNYQRAFKACTGDYVAILEGDDYWTDPQRLLKHVDFLENQPGCVLTMNRFTLLNADTGERRVPDWPSPLDHVRVTTSQMILENKLGNLSACVMRTSEVARLPAGLFELPIADWMIGIVISRNGFIAILKECMSVYRIHKNGQWSKMTAHEQLSKQIELAEIYNHFLKYQYDTEFGKLTMKLQAQLLPPAKPRGRRFVVFAFRQTLSRLFNYFIRTNERLP